MAKPRNASAPRTARALQEALERLREQHAGLVARQAEIASERARLSLAAALGESDGADLDRLASESRELSASILACDSGIRQAESELTAHAAQARRAADLERAAELRRLASEREAFLASEFQPAIDAFADALIAEYDHRACTVRATGISCPALKSMPGWLLGLRHAIRARRPDLVTGIGLPPLPAIGMERPAVECREGRGWTDAIRSRAAALEESAPP